MEYENAALALVDEDQRNRSIAELRQQALADQRPGGKGAQALLLLVRLQVGIDDPENALAHRIAKDGVVHHAAAELLPAALERRHGNLAGEERILLRNVVGNGLRAAGRQNAVQDGGALRGSVTDDQERVRERRRARINQRIEPLEGGAVVKLIGEERRPVDGEMNPDILRRKRERRNEDQHGNEQQNELLRAPGTPAGACEIFGHRVHQVLVLCFCCKGKSKFSNIQQLFSKSFEIITRIEIIIPHLGQYAAKMAIPYYIYYIGGSKIPF